MYRGKRPAALKAYVPRTQAGNLYYVRLATPIGPLYKLGVTTLKSVRERLAYQGNGDEKLVSCTMLFQHFDNAAEIESAVHEELSHHSAFGRFSNDPRMPLYGNGQSELYVSDILSMDALYCDQQKRETLSKIEKVRTGKELLNISSSPEDLQREQEMEEIVRDLKILPLIKGYARLKSILLDSSAQRRRKALVGQLINIAQEQKKNWSWDFTVLCEVRTDRQARIAARAKQDALLLSTSGKAVH